VPADTHEEIEAAARLSAATDGEFQYGHSRLIIQKWPSVAPAENVENMRVSPHETHFLTIRRNPAQNGQNRGLRVSVTPGLSDAEMNLLMDCDCGFGCCGR